MNTTPDPTPRDGSKDRDPAAPGPGFIRALRELETSRVEVPSEIDREILEMARTRLAPRRRVPVFLRLGRIAAAAAVLTLAALGWHFTRPELPVSEPVATTESSADPVLSGAAGERPPADIDGDGQVDIIDALVLARRLEEGIDLAALPDLDGSGQVDREDVETLARSLVRLN